MRAKSRRRNNSILQSNICKKITQLHRIIYDLSSASENLNSQREFLNSYFNPRIDDAINSYHEHIKKMQKVALDDYEFIVDRTDRFYQRKVRNLLKSYNDSIETLKSDSISKINELDEQKALTLQITKEMTNNISDQEKNYEQFVENAMNEIKSSISQEIKRSDDEMKLELEKLQFREQNYIKDSEKRMKEMKMSHDILVRQIHDNNRSPKLNLQSLISKIKDVKRCVYDSRNAFMSINSYQSQQLSKFKNNVTQMIREMQFLKNRNENELNNKKSQIDSQELQWRNQIDQLNQEFDKKRCDFQNELEKNQNEMNLLISKLNDDYNRKKNSLSINNTDNESQISILQKSLNESLIAYQLSIANAKKKYEDQIDYLKAQIESLNDNHLLELNKIEKEYHDCIDNHKLEIELIQQSNKKEIDKFINNCSNRLSQKKEYFMNCMYENSESLQKTKNMLNELKSKKNDIELANRHDLFSFDSLVINELDSIKNETKKLCNALEIELKSKYNCIELASQQMINDLIEKHKKEKMELISNLQEKHNTHIKSIQNLGDFGYEIDELEKEYSEQHRKLLDESKNMVPFIVKNDAFSDMNFFIKDLQSELNDHISMVNSNRRCLNLEWEQKLQEEYQRIENTHHNPPNVRARNQSIQSYKLKIDKLKQNRYDMEAQLKSYLSQLQENKTSELNESKSINDENPNDEIGVLKNLLNEIREECNQKIDEAAKITKNQKKLMNDEISPEIKSINNQIKTVIESKEQQTEFFNQEYDELNNTLQRNHEDFMKVYDDNKTKQNNILDKMKSEFLETQHLLRIKCQEQKYRNQRNADAFRTEEIEQLNLQKEQLKLKEMECLQSKSDLNQRMIKQRDELVKRINETKGKKEIVVKKVTDAQNGNIETKIDILEKQLQVKSILLNNCMREMMEYKTMYVSQEKFPTKRYQGVPDIGILQFKQMRANIDVI